MKNCYSAERKHGSFTPHIAYLISHIHYICIETSSLDQPSCANKNYICILFSMSEVARATLFEVSLSRYTAVETDFASD